jgi:uncharacterized protein (DUF1330 family)
MAAYVTDDVDVTDSARFEEYRRQVSPTIEKYGGRYLVQGGATEKVEGQWDPKRLVILEFDSMERAKAWYHSQEYKGPMQVRHQSASANVVFVEGAQ